jgi:hypothetical protein|tara:strand:- start:686 stop:997 length:312 start_codon:yes stop_codon:yes gene_type:complete
MDKLTGKHSKSINFGKGKVNKSPYHEVIPQNLDELSLFMAIKAGRDRSMDRASPSPSKYETSPSLKQIKSLLENSVGENSTQPTIGIVLHDAGGSIDKELDSF